MLNGKFEVSVSAVESEKVVILDLTMLDRDEVETKLQEIGASLDDVGSYELDLANSGDFPDYQVESTDDLNNIIELVDRLNDLNYDELEHLQAYLEASCDDLPQALNDYQDNNEYYSGLNLADLAEQLVNDGCFGDVSDNLRPFIDFDALGDALRDDGYTVTENGVIRLY